MLFVSTKCFFEVMLTVCTYPQGRLHFFVQYLYGRCFIIMSFILFCGAGAGAGNAGKGGHDGLRLPSLPLFSFLRHHHPLTLWLHLYGLHLLCLTLVPFPFLSFLSFFFVFVMFVCFFCPFACLPVCLPVCRVCPVSLFVCLSVYVCLCVPFVASCTPLLKTTRK